MLLRSRFFCLAKAFEDSSGKPLQPGLQITEEPRPLERWEWFSWDGISLGPVWKSGSQLLAWEGTLAEGASGRPPEGSRMEMQEITTLLAGLGQKGWRFLEGVWGPFRIFWVDLLSGTWLMARAPYGLKPLFWLCLPEGIFFSEEIPSLLDLMPCGPEPDWKRIPEYMVFQHVAGGNTLYKGVRELLPGEVILGNLASGKKSSQSLWPGWLESRTKQPPPPHSPELKEILWKAVHRRLAAEPEIPAGLFLSGGVDSALLACALKESDASTALPCLTVTCPGHPHDEAPFAGLVAKELELPWEPVELDPALFSKAWEEAVGRLGLPLTSTNQVVWWILSKAASELGLGRVFSGEGADGWLSGGLYAQEREALLLAGEELAKSGRVVINCRTHTLNEPLLVRQVLNKPLDLKPRIHLWIQCMQSLAHEHPMERAAFYHVRTVGNRLLTRADLAAQIHGLKLELPFVDESFLLWSKTMGWEKRNPPGLNKEPLKSLCCLRFGQELAYRKKIGFPFPIRTWIRDSGEKRIRSFREMLLENHTMSRPIYSSANLEREVRARLDKTVRPADWLLWSLINLELWLRWLEQRTRQPRCLESSLSIPPTSPAVS